MSNKVRPIPEGYHSITPYLIVNNGKEAIDFYKSFFNAEEIMCLEGPNGKVGHAELQIGDSKIMLADECPNMGISAPKADDNNMAQTILLYVENVDQIVERAVNGGAKLIRPVKDQFYGDRMGQIEDPFGHIWSISTHVEDVSPAEIQKRAKKACSGE